MSKQSNNTAVEFTPAEAKTPQTNPERQLFIKVDTFNSTNENIGTRIVDMYHFGTGKWLQNHLWWAAHNKNHVSVCDASEQEVSDYVTAQKSALAERFNAAA